LAFHKAAKKSVRQDRKARTRNRVLKSRIKTAGIKLSKAMANKQKDTIDTLFRNYVSIVDRAASKGVIHWNNAARKKRKMAQKLRTSLTAE